MEYMTLIAITALIVICILGTIWMVLNYKGALELFMDINKGQLNIRKNKDEQGKVLTNGSTKEIE